MSSKCTCLRAICFCSKHNENPPDYAYKPAPVQWAYTPPQAYTVNDGDSGRRREWRGANYNGSSAPTWNTKK